MTIHKSLYVGAGGGEKRSVFTRRERLERLKKEGRWSEEKDSVFGVPKVRTAFKAAVRKPKKAAAEEGAAAAPGAAAPAAEAAKADAGKGAKPAAGAKAGGEKKGK